MTNAMVANIYRQELNKMSSSTSPGALRNSSDDRKSLMSHLDPMIMRNMQPRRMGGLSADGSQEGGFSKEMVSRIYREELSKLSSAARKSGNLAEHNMYQQELHRIANKARENNDHKRPADDSRSPTPVKKIKTEPVDDIIPHRMPTGIDHSVMSLVKHKTERDTDTPLSSNHFSHSGRLSLSSPPSQSSPQSSPHEVDDTRHNGSAFYLVHPRPPSSMNGTPKPPCESPLRPPSSNPSLGGSTPQPFDAQGMAAAAAAIGYPSPMMVPSSAAGDGVSPLQRMQSIANSLMTANNANKPGAGLGFNSQQLGAGKPLRAVLPPISQDQFDRYSNINTDDLVHRVKETLSQYSISQRLFGEHILGLSQGSVSDLLARPKPWHMLTQKGREPFIRMKLFMEDQAAVLQLVSNQYHIEPDKLLRTNQMNGVVPPTAQRNHNNNIKTPCSKFQSVRRVYGFQRIKK